MGLILLAMLAVITVIALFIMRGASPLFRKLQKLPDRMSAVLLENIGRARRAGIQQGKGRRAPHERGVYGLCGYVCQGKPDVRKPRRHFLLCDKPVRHHRLRFERLPRDGERLRRGRHHGDRRVCPPRALLPDDGADGHPHAAARLRMRRTRARRARLFPYHTRPDREKGVVPRGIRKRRHLQKRGVPLCRFGGIHPERAELHL